VKAKISEEKGRTCEKVVARSAKSLWHSPLRYSEVAESKPL
jgi:hypothetical protein